MVSAAPPPIRRDQLAVTERVAYLDTAYATPLPLVAVEALTADALDAAARGSAALDDRAARLAEVRPSVAALLGVAPADVALVPNTARGLGAVAGGLDWRPGDRVVVRADDHPTTVLPWRVQEHRGVEVATVPDAVGPALVEAVAAELARGRVRVVAVSWVHAATGARTDLAALAAVAHDHGALLCVDAIQGAGVVPAAMADWGVDVVAAGAQKWMLGPHGIGAVAVRPEVAERLAVPTASAGSLVGAWSGGAVHLAGTIRRIEAGAADLGAAAAWGASLDLLATAPPGAVWTWCDRLATRLAEEARRAGFLVRSDRSGPARSAIVAVEVPGLDAVDVATRLADADVVVSARSGGVRLSPHGWNDDADVDAALAALRSL